MACRRAYLLETISSLQQHFINLYIFQPNQCKYGYDSSPACNSFQLGEMIRFFSRHDTLSLESTFCPPQQSPAMRGNILELMATLRSCPGYQIDSNHAHCGIRARFISGLELIMPLAQVGICARCWAEDAEAESWEDSPVGGRWNYTPRSQSGQLFGGCEAHRKAKVMYTAEERDWAFQPSWTAVLLERGKQFNLSAMGRPRLKENGSLHYRALMWWLPFISDYVPGTRKCLWWLLSRYYHWTHTSRKHSFSSPYDQGQKWALQLLSHYLTFLPDWVLVSWWRSVFWSCRHYHMDLPLSYPYFMFRSEATAPSSCVRKPLGQCPLSSYGEGLAMVGRLNCMRGRMVDDAKFRNYREVHLSMSWTLVHFCPQHHFPFGDKSFTTLR